MMIGEQVGLMSEREDEKNYGKRDTTAAVICLIHDPQSVTAGQVLSSSSLMDVVEESHLLSHRVETASSTVDSNENYS